MVAQPSSTGGRVAPTAALRAAARRSTSPPSLPWIRRRSRPPRRSRAVVERSGPERCVPVPCHRARRAGSRPADVHALRPQSRPAVVARSGLEDARGDCGHLRPRGGADDVRHQVPAESGNRLHQHAALELEVGAVRAEAGLEPRREPGGERRVEVVGAEEQRLRAVAARRARRDRRIERRGEAGQVGPADHADDGGARVTELVQDGGDGRAPRRRPRAGTPACSDEFLALAQQLEDDGINRPAVVRGITPRWRRSTNCSSRSSRESGFRNRDSGIRIQGSRSPFLPATRCALPATCYPLPAMSLQYPVRAEAREQACGHARSACPAGSRLSGPSAA